MVRCCVLGFVVKEKGRWSIGFGDLCFTTLKIKTVIILQAIVDNVETLLELARNPCLLPSVGALRPSNCPGCGQPASSPGKPLGIVGHGTYLRQVLGLVAAEEIVLRIRRYLCRGCRQTLSILPDLLHPRRWYAAGVILEALRLHLLEGRGERAVRDRFGVGADSESWRSLRRWRFQLLYVLWHWLAEKFGAHGPAATREEGCRRLRRLLGAMDASNSSDAKCRSP